MGPIAPLSSHLTQRFHMDVFVSPRITMESPKHSLCNQHFIRSLECFV